MPRAPSLRSLFLAWVCFSLAFSTVFQAFLTTFLIDSGYKTPIQNKVDLYASGIKLVYEPEYIPLINISDEKETAIVQRNTANCPKFLDCLNMARKQRNMAVILSDLEAELYYANGELLGENSEHLLCRLEDGVVFNSGNTMLTFHGEPLLKRINEIIVRMVEAGLCKHIISQVFQYNKLKKRMLGIKLPLDEYYSFSLYHMQPAFYLLLMGWCLSALCFMVELLYSRVLCKIM
jgi:hypothetical protein